MSGASCEGRDGNIWLSLECGRWAMASVGAIACSLILTHAMQRSANAESLEETAQRAITVYRHAMEEPDRTGQLDQFARAAQLFRQAAELAALPSGRLAAASLWSNAGNAAFQADELGRAVLAYRRALQIDAGNRKAKTNLQFARQQLPARWRAQAGNSIWTTLFFWNDVLAGTAAQWAAWCFALATVLWAVSIRFDKPIARNLAIIPALLWVVLMLSILISLGQDPSHDAVIVGAEVTARTADSQNAAAQFSAPLPAGVEVSVIQTRLDWAQVRLSSGETTWLPKSSIEYVVAS